MRNTPLKAFAKKTNSPLPQVKSGSSLGLDLATVSKGAGGIAGLMLSPTGLGTGLTTNPVDRMTDDQKKDIYNSTKISNMENASDHPSLKTTMNSVELLNQKFNKKR